MFRQLAGRLGLRRFRRASKITFLLPPRNSRFCTEEWQDDAFYFSSAVKEACRLVQLCGLNDATRFVDIGSGQGRMAIGLQAMFPTLKSYIGIDVHASSVAWCNHCLALPNFRFLHVDTKNERYNPEGRSTGRLPVADQSADIIFLYSVFTHMRLTDIQWHVAEICRALAPGGRCLLTIYAEQWPKEEEENPPGYLSELGNHSGTLHRVVIDKVAFENICSQASLSVRNFMYRCEEVTKQSVYVLLKN